MGSAGTCHTVLLTGLLAGTTYYYQLKTNGTVVQATTYFSTLKDPTDTSELFFTVIGDWGRRAAPSRRSRTSTTRPTRDVITGEKRTRRTSDLANNAMPTTGTVKRML